MCGGVSNRDFEDIPHIRIREYDPALAVKCLDSIIGNKESLNEDLMWEFELGFCMSW